MSVLTPDESSPEGAVGVSGRSPKRLLVFIGVLGCLLAVLSVVDMFMPKAYDGVVPDTYSTGGIVVRDVVPGGAAEKAGLRPGDTVLGIGHHMLNKAAEAPPELRRHGAGEAVDYLVRRGQDVFETKVVLMPFRLGSASYFYFAFLGLLFFVLGAFVVSRRADDPAVQVFYVLCILFMLFFICRLRPSSYYWIDYVVQVAGTLALFLLPAVFLHFFLLFPSKKTFRFAERAPGEAPGAPWLFALQRFLNRSPLLLTTLYTLPPVLYVLQMAGAGHGAPRRLIYGAPTLNWILLADYLILGLLALAHTWWASEDRAARQPILVLLLGTVAGIVPFVVFAVFFPSLFRTDRYLAWGVVPMALIPLTFAYAIVRFRLFDVEVIVRKSLVYAILTAVVTGFYALCVVAGNALVSTVSSSTLFSSPAFAFGFGLVVVLLFDPVRRRMQRVVDRVFFRDRADFQQALLDMSRSVVSQLERPKLRALLTSRTAELLRLESLDLLLPRGEDGVFTDGAAGGAGLPALPMGAVLPRLVLEKGAPVRLGELETWMLDADSRAFVTAARQRHITVILPLATHGKLLGLLAVGRKRSEEDLSREDLDHLLTIANQGALGLEAAGLHEELTRRAEMERDLDIAREIQTSLFPRELPRVPGVSFFGVSRPARVVGGDFYDFLEVDGDVAAGGRLGLVVGDVSGKSIPASLLMVAAKEIVYARAMADPDPGVVFRESNRRLYDIKRRMFVSLAYFLLDPKALSLTYAFGGQPTPLLVRVGASGAVEIPVPKNRLPLGALRDVHYDTVTFYLSPGDLLLFYTDGLNEAMSAEMAPYGDERLKASFVRHARLPLQELADELLEDIRQFTQGAEQYDDQTFVLMRIEPAGANHGNRVVDEHFVPGGKTDLQGAIELGDANAVHHLIRYEWAVSCLKDWPVSSVLDLATGSGYGAHTIAERIPSARVKGIDYDADAIREARQRYSRPNLEFQTGDGTRWRQTIGSRKYDVIVSFDMIEHVAHREILMENVVDHLVPQGVLLLSTPCGWDENNLQPDWRHHKLEYSAASLYDFLHRYFTTVIRPEDGGFPHLEVFDQLANGPVTYLLKMNPVVCRGPRVLASPYAKT